MKKRDIDYVKFGINKDVNSYFYQHIEHLDLTYMSKPINGYKPYFLLNKEHAENSLPNLPVPLIIDNNVIVDLRMFAKKKLDLTEKLDEAILDRENYNIQIISAVLLTAMEKEEFRRNIAMHSIAILAESLGYVVRTSYNLSPIEEIGFKTMLMANMACLVYDMEKDETRSLVKHKIASSLPGGINVNQRYVDEYMSKFKVWEDFDGYVENLQQGVSDINRDKITHYSLISVLSGLSFSVNVKKLLTISLTSVSVWTAIMYVHAKSKSFKNSKLSKILDNKKRALNIPDLLEDLEGYELKEYKHLLLQV